MKNNLMVRSCTMGCELKRRDNLCTVVTMYKKTCSSHIKKIKSINGAYLQKLCTVKYAGRSQFKTLLWFLIDLLSEGEREPSKIKD